MVGFRFIFFVSVLYRITQRGMNSFPLPLDVNLIIAPPLLDSLPPLIYQKTFVSPQKAFLRKKYPNTLVGGDNMIDDSNYMETLPRGTLLPNISKTFSSSLF